MLNLAFSLPAFADVIAKPINIGGSLSRCWSLSNIGLRGFYLKPYTATVTKGILAMQVIYINVECQELADKKVGFKPVQLKNNSDLLIFDSPIRVFDVVSVPALMNKSGSGYAVYRNNLKNILSDSDYEDYLAGKAVKKAFYIFYGNFFGDDVNDLKDYIRSGGYGILELKIQGDQVEIKGFNKNQEVK